MTDRPKVLFLLPSIAGGGAERVAVTLLRNLDQARFQLAVAVLESIDPAFISELPAELEYVDLKCRRARYSFVSLLRLSWSRRPTIIFSTLGHLNLSLALLRPFLPRRTSLIARETAVISDQLHGRLTKPLWTLAYRSLYRRFDRVVCQSEAMKQELVAQFQLPPERAVVIRNPVDLERVHRLAQEPLPTDAGVAGTELPGALRLVAAGRLSHEKGFDLLIEAMASLNDRRIYLTMLGDGPQRAALEALVHKRDLSKQVRFLGFQNNPYSFFSHASALVLPSRSDAFPNVILEALACGLPVISTPASAAVRDFLGSVASCVMADDVSVPGLARAIGHFATCAGTQPRPSCPDEFAVTNVVASYSELFCSLASTAS